MTTTMKPKSAPTTPRTWRQRLAPLMLGVTAALIGSAAWSSAGYLAAHLSLHWH